VIDASDWRFDGVTVL